MKNNLPGIKKVGFCRADNLQPDIVSPLTPHSKLKAYGTFTYVDIVGVGEMYVHSSEHKGSKVYDTRVSFNFTTCFAFLFDQILSYPHVVELTGIDDSVYIVGTDTKPYPTITLTNRNDAGKKVIECVITLKSTLPPLLRDK